MDKIMFFRIYQKIGISDIKFLDFFRLIYIKKFIFPNLRIIIIYQRFLFIHSLNLEGFLFIKNFYKII